MNNKLYLAALLLYILLLPVTSVSAQQPQTDSVQAAENSIFPATAEEWAGKTVIIPVKGVIAPENYGGQQENIIKAITLAEKAERIIMEIDSPGGVVDSCDKICNALISSPTATTAVVIRKAVSGGAMVATACADIYMLSGSRLGDIQPMMMMSSQSLDDRTAEKAEADVRAIMSANARHNGYPQVLLEAMVTRSFEVYEVNFKNGDREFLKKPAYELLRQSMEEGIESRQFSSPPKIVVTTGKLLSVEAQTAVEYDIARKVLQKQDEIFSILSINPDNIVRVDLPEGEMNPLKLLNFDKWKMSKGLTMLLIFCLLIGVAGTFTEMHIPGFGLPGALGLIGFASFFTILFLNERATVFEIGLFVTGIILLVVEIVLIPGFGVAGVLGLICLLGGLVFSLLPAFDTDYMEFNSGGEIMFAALVTGGVLLAGCILVIIIMERGGKSHLLSSIFLNKSLPKGREARKKGIEKDNFSAPRFSEDEYSRYMGTIGTAYTTLRPSGKIKTENGELLDVVTPGEFIDRGEKVVVIAIDMNRIVVDKYTD